MFALLIPCLLPCAYDSGSIAAGNTLGPLMSGLILHHSGYAAPLIFQLTCGLAGKTPILFIICNPEYYLYSCLSSVKTRCLPLHVLHIPPSLILS